MSKDDLTWEIVPSACGHEQPPPTDLEIANCEQIIARECAECGRPLWWNVDQWRAI